jgi:hypothetical protein
MPQAATWRAFLRFESVFMDFSWLGNAAAYSKDTPVPNGFFNVSVKLAVKKNNC